MHLHGKYKKEINKKEQMSINHILAQVVNPLVAPLPLQDLQCDKLYANEIISPPALVGLIPSSQAAATANTALIQAALVDNATVTIPVGTYFINGTLLVTGDNITLQGSQGCSGACVLKMADSVNLDMVYVATGAASILTGFCMRNLVLDGNITNNTLGNALTFYSVFQPIVQNCTIQFAPLVGIKGDAPSTPLATSLMSIDKCHINQSGTNNIFINTFCQDSIIRDTFCEIAGSVGILVKGSGNKIINSHSYNNVSHNITLDAFSVRTEVSGCILDASNTGWGLVITGSQGNIVTNNIFFNEFSGCISLDTSGGQLASLNVVANNVLYSEVAHTYPTPVGIAITATNVWNMILNNSVNDIIATRYDILEPINNVVDPFADATFAYNNVLGGTIREAINQTSGASPVTSNFQNSLITFTGLADTAVGATVAMDWKCASMAATSVIRVTLLGQSVAATANLAVQSFSPGVGQGTLTLVSNGAATTGAAGSAIILFEFIL